MSFVERRLADALARNVETGRPPPFALVQVAETLGLAPLQPAAVSPAMLADTLLAKLAPERTGPEAVLAAHEASETWTLEFDAVSTWFEAGPEVEALLRPLKSRKKRLDAILKQLLPARRQFWAGRCAWMAATLEEQAEDDDDAWIEFALVARDLAGDKPLDAIPLARSIAAATVEVFAQR
jgi:hypothetical protein